LMLIRLRQEHGGDGTPIAFGAHFIGAHHYAPMVVGLDYDYVQSHGVYRQGMRQVLLRARALGAERLLLGMGAALEKQRFGAHALPTTRTCRARTTTATRSSPRSRPAPMERVGTVRASQGRT